MYKILAKADNVDEAAYTNLKAEFNAYKKTLRPNKNAFASCNCSIRCREGAGTTFSSNHPDFGLMAVGC